MTTRGAADADRDRGVSALFQRHYSPLCRLAYVILGDAALAEEIVMEALLKTYSGWGRIRDVERSDAYLKRAVVNLCRSRIRRAGMESRVNAAIHHGEARRASLSPQDRRDTALDVWAAVRALPERQRVCVVLRYFADLPEGEIAQTMDCSVGTVKSQLSKARRKLEAALGEPGSEEAR